MLNEVTHPKCRGWGLAQGKPWSNGNCCFLFYFIFSPSANPCLPSRCFRSCPKMKTCKDTHTHTRAQMQTHIHKYTRMDLHMNLPLSFSPNICRNTVKLIGPGASLSISSISSFFTFTRPRGGNTQSATAAPPPWEEPKQLSGPWHLPS